MSSIKPKYIRIVSDTHLDFDVPTLPFIKKFERLWKPEPLMTDKETAFIIAGDIWHAKKPFDFNGKSWIAQLSKQFKYVILILGNHDFWEGDISEEYQYYRTSIAKQDLMNVFMLQNSSLYFDGLKIIGATLWTDYLQENYVCMSNARLSGMKDYSYIQDTESPVSPQKLLKEHQQSKKYIFENCKKDYPEQKIIVVTHHSPSYQSLPEKLRGDEYQIEKALYHSDLDDYIARTSIDLWIHGHSHYKVDYLINKTRVISNPRGYSDEDTGYNPWLLIETNNLSETY